MESDTTKLHFANVVHATNFSQTGLTTHPAVPAPVRNGSTLYPSAAIFAERLSPSLLGRWIFVLAPLLVNHASSPAGRSAANVKAAILFAIDADFLADN